jgi:hypothetical protein
MRRHFLTEKLHLKKKICYQICLCGDKSTFRSCIIAMDERQVYGDVQNNEGYSWTVITYLILEIGCKFSFLMRIPS